MAKLRILALTYKTFPVPLSEAFEATVDALKRMGLRVLPNGSADDGVSVSILATGWRRELEVELETQGVRNTRMRVLAKEGFFFEENAATDLIAHVARLLEQPSGARALAHVGSVADPMAMSSSDAQVSVLSR